MGKAKTACGYNTQFGLKQVKIHPKISWEALTHLSKNMSTRVPERITAFIAIELKQLQFTVTFQWPRHIPEYTIHLSYQAASC
jgi:hypothetical protein